MYHILGDKVVHDYGMSREFKAVLQILLESKWELAALDAEKRMEVAQLACFVFLGYS
jgi:hypothetical protein